MVILELSSGDSLEANTHPIGALYYGVSLLYCLSTSLAAGGPGLAGGSRDPKQIIQAAGCLACHKLEGQGQVIAPDLTHVGSRRDADAIRRKILDPASSITQGYEKLAGIMPKTFGSMMSASQLEALVEYLAGHK